MNYDELEFILKLESKMFEILKPKECMELRKLLFERLKQIDSTDITQENSGYPQYDHITKYECDTK